MHHQHARHLIIILLAAGLLLGASGLFAGTKVKVKGDVDTVAEQVEEAFENLEITASDTEKYKDWARTVGKAKSGARVTVAVNQAGDDECELSVSSESPEDPDIEQRFLRMMQSR